MVHVASPINGSRLVLGACVLLLLLTGCTSGSDDPLVAPSSAPTTSNAPTLESVAQDLLPDLATAPMARSSNLPTRIAVPSQRPPSLMTAPSARAKLGMVRLDDDFSADGFADHDVYFLGVDDQWRALNLAELGLPASDWTGPDGDGMGDLSADGTHWAFVTTRHVVVLDLLTRKMQFLSLPGGRTPVPGRWTVRNTLLVGLEIDSEVPATSYEVDPKTGRSTLIKAPAWRVTVLADGSRAIKGLKGNQPYVTYVSAANRPIRRAEYGFASDEPLGMQVKRDVAVFLDSLGFSEPVDHGSTLVVVDKSLRLKAALPWPERTNGDSTIGWVSDDTYLLKYGKTLAAWCPGRSKLSRVSTVPRDLAISMAMDVVDASCT